jgi:hypothetical protein
MAEQARLTAVVVDGDKGMIDRITGMASACPDVEVVGTATDEQAVQSLVSRSKPDVVVVGRWVDADPRSASYTSAAERPLVSGLEVANRFVTRTQR